MKKEELYKYPYDTNFLQNIFVMAEKRVLTNEKKISWRNIFMLKLKNSFSPRISKKSVGKNIWSENFLAKIEKQIIKSENYLMDKLSRSQLPDSSSSPPLSVIFHNFDDDVISDLPSCVYANHHQMNSNNQVMGSGNSGSLLNPGNSQNPLRINTNSIRQIQQHYLHHAGTFFFIFLRKCLPFFKII